jgi:transposase, IS30 family
MSNYTHLTASERDQIADLNSVGSGVQAIAAALGRSASTISRELRRNALDSGAYRPIPAEGAYLLRRQRPAKLERDNKLRSYVLARLSEGWTPEQICGRLRQGIERGLGLISTEAIYAWIYSKARKADRLWRSLPRGRPRRGRRKRPSKDHIAEKTHISERTEAANQREEVGHWEADLVICKRSRPVLVLHERKTRLTLISRLMGKTAAETVSVLMALVKRLAPTLRGSITFDNGGEFARHALLRDMLSATTYFCDAYASWQKGGVENTNGRIRRWLPRSTDLDELSDKDIQEIAMTLNSTPRKCLAFKTPIEAMLAELGKDVQIRFA